MKELQNSLPDKGENGSHSKERLPIYPDTFAVGGDTHRESKRLSVCLSVGIRVSS